MNPKTKKGFTLVELLIVMAVVGTIVAAVVVVLNPGEILAQARDSQRMSDISTLTSAIRLYITQPPSTGINFGSCAPGGRCTGSPTPGNGPFGGASSTCNITSAGNRNVDGTGWLDINFNAMPSGSPLPVLPTDPTDNGIYFYGYMCSNSDNLFEVTGRFESEKYRGKMISDNGGNSTCSTYTENTCFYEAGNYLNFNLAGPLPPTFIPAVGEIASGTLVSIVSPGADAVYYTTNGDTPTTGSALYTTPFIATSFPFTLKAIAVKSGLGTSAIGSASYSQGATADLSNIALSGSPVNYSFSGGTYSYTGATVSNAVSSIIVTPTGSGTITVNGTTVASGSASGSISLTAGTPSTITVITTETGKTSKTYTIQVTRNSGVQATPTFSPVGGGVTIATPVTITSSGAEHIYYTTNGDNPTSASTEYTVPVSATLPFTLKALATKSGYDNSAVGSASYALETEVVFNSSQTWTVPAGAQYANIFLVGGGGGGGTQYGGGGGGGYTKTFLNIAVSSGENIPIIIGDGGIGGTHPALSTYTQGTDGGFSQFKNSTYKANGGKGGVAGSGGNGGSGGAHGTQNPSAGLIGGSNGGNGQDAWGFGSPGVGQGYTTTAFESGTGVIYSGGGGGGNFYASSGCPGGLGGLNGGGNGGGGTNSTSTNTNGKNGTPNTGGGGGGGGSAFTNYGLGGNGGSGIVIVRYR